MNEYEFLMMQSSYQLSGCIAAYEDEKKQSQ